MELYIIWYIPYMNSHITWNALSFFFLGWRDTLQYGGLVYKVFLNAWIVKRLAIHFHLFLQTFMPWISFSSHENKMPNFIFEGHEWNCVFVCAIKSIVAWEYLLINYNLNRIDIDIASMRVVCKFSSMDHIFYFYHS